MRLPAPTRLYQPAAQNESNVRGRAPRLAHYKAAARRADGHCMDCPGNFYESLRSCVSYIERCRRDQGMSKGDVLDGIEERVSVMMGKALSAPTATSFCVFRLDEEIQAAATYPA